MIQLRKRLPVDLSGVLGVAPFFMAKTLGSYAIAESRLRAAGEDGHPEPFAEALLGHEDIARVGEGAWGYEFDVQTRWAFYPAGSSNLISTVFCSRGLACAGIVCGRPDWVGELHKSADFIRRTLQGPAGWFRYTADSDRLVHNANLLGAAVVAASGRLRGDRQMVSEALRAALISVEAQDANGGWPYGVGAGLGWQDSFHTAYNLDALLHVWLATREQRVHDALSVGAATWSEAFFSADGAPAYYVDGSGPRDIHSAGTAIDVAARLAQRGLCRPELARTVLAWTDAHLVAADGTTYFAERNGKVDHRHFVRWGDAHLALGRASVALMEAGFFDPLEAALEGVG